MGLNDNYFFIVDQCVMNEGNFLFYVWKIKLCVEVILDEIEKVFFCIRNDKDLGIDGYNVYFL